jgi:hypothetical protein
MIEANAITKIEQLVQDKQVIEHNEEKFVPIGYHVLRNVDRYDSLWLNTLYSLVSFVNENTQGINLEGAICVVNEDLSVSVLSAPNSVDLKRTELVIPSMPRSCSTSFCRHDSSTTKRRWVCFQSPANCFLKTMFLFLMMA